MNLFTHLNNEILQFIQNATELVIEAGCRTPQWNDDSLETYTWQSDGELLAKGACVIYGSQKHLVPNFGNTKVICKFLHQKVRNVDSRQQTMSIDMTLSMKWWDPSVKHSPTQHVN